VQRCVLDSSYHCSNTGGMDSSSDLWSPPNPPHLLPTGSCCSERECVSPCVSGFCSYLFFPLFLCFSISESFLTVKGAALFLPRGNSPTPNSAPRISQRRNKHTGDLQKHLQTMFTVLRPEDTIRLAVRLESAYPQVTRYMVVVSTNGRQDTEESIVLGMDFVSSDSGFSVSTVNRVHVFKPVSVQAMWSALQSLHKACEVARCHNHYPGSLFLTWVSYYQSRISSNQFCINEWNAMQDVESHRANSPVLFTDLPTERERTERLIKMRLREIMMQKDLENVTCKEIRTELEMQMVCNLREFKEFIDNEMIVILGQMDSPTEIFEHVYLGSEWNASNLEELQNSGVRYILNVTREIDNFFPGMFEYHNIRVYDEEATNLLEYWNDTYKFITKAKKAGAKCLVHCKMGVSRSASTVIAYAMKEYGWDLDTAFDYVKDKRAVTKPNPSFMKQLEEYQGILLASKQRHNKLWRSHSDSDLSERPELMCKPSSPSLGRSDSHNNNNTPSSPSLHHFLGVAVLQALGASHEDSAKFVSVSVFQALPQSEDGADPSHHDNGVSVRHIVTEIEAIWHPPTPSSPSPSPSPSSHSLQLVQLQHPEETDSSELPHGSPAAPAQPPSPSATLPRDWPAGSVRRATEQLEQKLKQELEMSASQRSPLHSPSTEHPPSRLSPCSPNAAEHPPLRPAQPAIEQGITQGEKEGVSVHPKSKEKQTGSRSEPQRPDPSGTDHLPDRPKSSISQACAAAPVTVLPLPSSHMKTPLLAPTGQSVALPPDTSAQPQSQNLQRQTPSRMTVDGVTLQESDADDRPHAGSQGRSESCSPGCDARVRLARGSQELEQIQQTLRELQAFLHEGVSLEAADSPVPDLGQPPGLRDAMDTEPGQCRGESCEPTPPGLEVGQQFRGRQEGRGVLEQTGWHRAMELEARIRQAGLTPPSLMKRSASLAKLDCLELSANDLSDLDMRPHNRKSSLSSSSQSQDSFSPYPSHPDDIWKKQKVLALNSCVKKTDLPGDGASLGHSCPKEDTCRREEPDDGGGGASSSRQQGRGHSTRRSRKASAEKKQRASTVLYNTM
uniref:protein-serine/threonine phosphatase n=1 Tax=Salarias fasciatus TaxID=181472 RepID=A0A672IAD7_SALFA